MNDIFDMMEDDFKKTVSSFENIDNNDLKSLNSFAEAIRLKENLIADLEQKLKDEKKALLKMTDEDLPSMLSEVGMLGFTMLDGSEVKIKQTYGGSILVKNRQKAFEWLRNNGHGDIIKNKITCKFGQGEDDEANHFKGMAQDQGYVTEQKEEVHQMTLRSWIQDLVEAGEDFPMDLFGAFIGQKAVIEEKKRSK